MNVFDQGLIAKSGIENGWKLVVSSDEQAVLLASARSMRRPNVASSAPARRRSGNYAEH